MKELDNTGVDLADIGTGRTLLSHFQCSQRGQLIQGIKSFNKLTETSMNIKDHLKKLTLKEPNKTFVKAGMMSVDGDWNLEIIDQAITMMREEYMATKEFTDTMLTIAKDIIKDRK